MYRCNTACDYLIDRSAIDPIGQSDEILTSRDSTIQAILVHPNSISLVSIIVLNNTFGTNKIYKEKFEAYCLYMCTYIKQMMARYEA